jgi:hypothetical protein
MRGLECETLLKGGRGGDLCWGVEGRYPRRSTKEEVEVEEEEEEKEEDDRAGSSSARTGRRSMAVMVCFCSYRSVGAGFCGMISISISISAV